MPVKKRGFERISKIVGSIEGRARDEMRNAVGEAVETGEIMMANYIQARGTGKTWKPGWSTSTLPNAFYGRGASSPGRVATGLMRDSVTSSVDSDSKYRVRGRFGWLKGSQEYFLLQDGGFRHSITGQSVKAMHAQRDAAKMADEAFLKAAEAGALRIIRGG